MLLWYVISFSSLSCFLSISLSFPLFVSISLYFFLNSLAIFFRLYPSRSTLLFLFNYQVSTNIRIRILATATETVEQLKERVKETLHIPAEEISLQVDRPNQKITLENGHTLAYYNFTDNEVPYVTIKPVDGLLVCFF